MDATTLLSLLATAVTAGLVIFAMRQHARNTRDLRILRAKQISAHNHLQKSRMDLMETRNRARLLEETVKNGTSAVEKVHRTITTTTFSLIDRFSTSEELRENARRARRSHDQTSDRIYRTVHTTNKALHILADSLFIGKKEKKLTTRRSPKGE
ncbi:hypothetical protein FDP08_02665 [Marinobacter panjinensis]|uniref:Uncharacterized protein n=1 Tax=Marinobacter panjinensis TaxID=2576384 RepID=A0A4U6R0D1_9GAMM|nr:hypothetical protein [Marinobacter panjinensis]MCR8915966.1 hypothetical protein [Marinobacter panjinensis]TKV67067.1 hypothetical protein FDP08_02665 [Marinobacter panjinensis]